MKINDLIQRIQKNNYFPKSSNWIFIVLFLLLSVIYNYHTILFKSPQSVHQWRQTDCLSITMNYYQNNNSFLEPSVHNLGRDETGKTVSDFPLIYFSIAYLWKIFGHYEFIYRLVVMLFFFFGLFTLFKFFENILKDSIIAITSTLFLFTSPTLVYYANNFLMDIPAFSLALIGFYFFFKFTQSSKNTHVYLFVFLYAIAGLLKISSLLSFMAIVGLFIIELLGVKLNPERKIFHQPVKQGILFIGVLTVQLIWYMYANNYNAKYNSGFFLIGILPIWEMNIAEIKRTFTIIDEHINWDYFRKETQLVLLAIFIFTLTLYKKANKIILLLMILTAIGAISYSILFFGAFKDHDYYTINLFILTPMIIAGFLLLLKDKFNFIYTSLLFKCILIAFLIHNIDFARRRMQGRYSPTGWQNRDYIQNTHSFEEIPTYLRSIGIKKEDRIISISDNSINITLYLMNQKGWTNFGMIKDSLKIRDKINQGANYLLIDNKFKGNAAELYKEKSIQPFIKNKVGEFKNIDVYRLNL